MDLDMKKAVEGRVQNEDGGHHERQKERQVAQDPTFDRYCIEAGEVGAGIIFARLHEGKFIFNKDSLEWWVWAGHHWVIDKMNNALKDVEKVALWYIGQAIALSKQIEKAGSQNNKATIEKLQRDQRLCNKMVARLRTETGRQICLKTAHSNHVLSLEVSSEQFDQDPWLFACKNGVIDLQTGEIRPGRPHDYITKASPVGWEGIEAPAPEWERVLLEIHNGDIEIVRYMQRLYGSAIVGKTSEAVVPVQCGGGRNGKTTENETIAAVVGDMAGPIPSQMLLDQGRYQNSAAPSPDLMDLKGLRIAFASEIEEGRRFSAARVKWLSGSDTITARAPHDRRSTKFRPTHTLFLMTNSKPGAPANDFAFWSRVNLIPYEISFVDRQPKTPNERRIDKHIPEKLTSEYPGILTWLVRGCLQWQKMGLCPPEKVLAATEQYRRDEDFLQDFIDEYCFVDPSETESAADLYDAFKGYWTSNVSKKPPSRKSFGQMIGSQFKRVKRSTIRYEGLRLVKT
ncbi:phage/plasmid primase, P4 family, C-terminal domain protein [delta proteobacterium NaphS2]|nr:phage/plasmid primase, P4 family, C-terminal domain protein [delta proteobacterium NaphS2]